MGVIERAARRYDSFRLQHRMAPSRKLFQARPGVGCTKLPDGDEIRRPVPLVRALHRRVLRHRGQRPPQTVREPGWSSPGGGNIGRAARWRTARGMGGAGEISWVRSLGRAAAGGGRGRFGAGRHNRTSGRGEIPFAKVLELTGGRVCQIWSIRGASGPTTPSLGGQCSTKRGTGGGARHLRSASAGRQGSGRELARSEQVADDQKGPMGSPGRMAGRLCGSWRGRGSDLVRPIQTHSSDLGPTGRGLEFGKKPSSCLKVHGG